MCRESTFSAILFCYQLKYVVCALKKLLRVKTISRKRGLVYIGENYRNYTLQHLP